MRCQLCLNISWQPLCKNCLKTILQPTPSKRVLEDGLVVYSVYSYKDIKDLLHTKHTYFGAKIFSELTKHALVPLIKTFTCKDVYSIPIDDHIRSGYSHSAVIARELREYLKPLYKSLRAKNRIRYSGKNYAYDKKRRGILLLHVKKI